MMYMTLMEHMEAVDTIAKNIMLPSNRSLKDIWQMLPLGALCSQVVQAKTGIIRVIIIKIMLLIGLMRLMIRINKKYVLLY